jgi:hypothetical protein
MSGRQLVFLARASFRCFPRLRLPPKSGESPPWRKEAIALRPEAAQAIRDDFARAMPPGELPETLQQLLLNSQPDDLRRSCQALGPSKLDTPFTCSALRPNRANSRSGPMLNPDWRRLSERLDRRRLTLSDS